MTSNIYHNIHIEGSGRVLLGNEYVSEPKSQRILKWLSPIDPWAKHKEARDQFRKGTLDWFFNDGTFSRWLNGDTQVLWCPGAMGTGKTILMSAILEHLSRQSFAKSDVAVAFVYCQHQAREIQTLSNILGCLLAQLYSIGPGNPNIPSSVSDAYTSRPNISPTTEQLQGWFIEEIESQERYMILLDGLDEMNQQLRDELLDIVEFSSFSHLQVLVTSRPLPDIKTALLNPTIVQIHAPASSIDALITSRLDSPSSRRFRRLIDANNVAGERWITLEREMRSKVIGKSQGMLLLASLQLDLILNSRRLVDIWKTLDNLPPTLDRYYDMTWQRINSYEDSRDTAYAKIALSWTLHASRPLSSRQLQHAMAASLSDECNVKDGLIPEEDLLSLCAGLLISSTATLGNIAFSHFSATEYFSARRLQYFPDAHDLMTQSCVRYLEIWLEGPSIAPQPWTEPMTNEFYLRKQPPFPCNSCREKKIRCTGEKPDCKQCQRFSIPCVYNESRAQLRLTPHAPRNPRSGGTPQVYRTTREILADDKALAKRLGIVERRKDGHTLEPGDYRYVRYIDENEGEALQETPMNNPRQLFKIDRSGLGSGRQLVFLDYAYECIWFHASQATSAQEAVMKLLILHSVLYEIANDGNWSKCPCPAWVDTNSDFWYVALALHHGLTNHAKLSACLPQVNTTTLFQKKSPTGSANSDFDWQHLTSFEARRKRYEAMALPSSSGHTVSKPLIYALFASHLYSSNENVSRGLHERKLLEDIRMAILDIDHINIPHLEFTSMLLRHLDKGASTFASSRAEETKSMDGSDVLRWPTIKSAREFDDITGRPRIISVQEKYSPTTNTPTEQDLNIEFTSKFRPAWYAYVNRDFDLLRRLVKHGADLSALTDDPVLSLRNVAIEGGHSDEHDERMLKFLAYGPDKAWFKALACIVNELECIDGVWQARIEIDLNVNTKPERAKRYHQLLNEHYQDKQEGFEEEGTERLKAMIAELEAEINNERNRGIASMATRETSKGLTTRLPEDVILLSESSTDESALISDTDSEDDEIDLNTDEKPKRAKKPYTVEKEMDNFTFRAAVAQFEAQFEESKDAEAYTATGNASKGINNFLPGNARFSSSSKQDGLEYVSDGNSGQDEDSSDWDDSDDEDDATDDELEGFGHALKRFERLKAEP